MMLELANQTSPLVSVDLQRLVIRRLWQMPTADTFDMPEVAGFVKKRLMKSLSSIDPFARNKRWAKYTNDLNPDTAAEHHLDAHDFLEMLIGKNVSADLVIFDPPYSREQVKQVYAGIGRSYGLKDSQDHSTNWRAERDLVDKLLCVNGIVLSFGWNTNGMGIGRRYAPEEILIVCHGGSHNDTLCLAERKLEAEPTLWATDNADLSDRAERGSLQGKVRHAD